MKHLISILLSVLFCTSVAFAQTEEVTLVLNIDDINHVTIDKFGEEITGLQSGENTLQVSPWTNIGIVAKEGFTLTSVVNAAGEAQSITNNKSCSVFIGDTNETLTITTAEISIVNFTLKVDDASVVRVVNAEWSAVSIHDGTNELSMSATQLPLGITSTKYQPFYKVTLDGEEIPYNWGYSVTPKEGSVIDIQTQYPDVDFNVTFSYVDPANSDFFCAVFVNDEPVDFANGFAAKAGSKVALYYNTGLWYNTQEDSDHPLKINLNGEEFKWFGSGSSFILSKDTEVQVAEASRKPSITVQLTVDNIDGLKVYSGSESNKDVIAMHTGANTITVGEDDACIVIETVNDNYHILGATVNDEDIDVNYYNYLSISNLKQGDVISVTTNNPQTSIETIFAPEADSAVYTISGVKVLDNASYDKINKLSSGLYIIKGKKVFVK